MIPIKLILILFIIKPNNCQEINNYFENINKILLKFNRISAEIAWENSVNPGNPELVYKSAEIQEKNIKWQHETCDKLAILKKRHLLNATQSRQTYLLCRGPRFYYDEARLASKLYEQIQTIYNEAEICIPSEKNVNTLEEQQAAILDYLTAVKSLKRFQPLFLEASKLNNKSFCLKGDGDFQKLMEYSRNELVLKWVWTVWRDSVGPPMKEPYLKFADIQNRAARRNSYPNLGASWRDELEVPNLRQKCLKLLNSVKPLYTLLHGITRYFLRIKYGNIVPEKGPIPAHLLGNLWSQNWESLTDLIISNDIDLNESIKKQKWTVLFMVKRAADFYQSLGLPELTDQFWRESKFTRENDSMRCHGTAADMFQDGDFRLLYCSNTTKEDFYVLHHEIGHIQYYMAYDKQPTLFRQANTALHESIGDAIMIGAMTPQHLHRLGLINDTLLFNNDNEIDTEINGHDIDLNEPDTGLDGHDIGPNKEGAGLNNHDTDVNEPDIALNRHNILNEINKRKSNNNFEDYSKNTKNIMKLKGKKYDSNEFLTKNINLLDDNNVINYSKLNKNDKTNEIKEQNNPNHAKDIFKTTDDILLLKQALNKIPQIPFTLVIDEFRWRIFEGSVAKEMNNEFWDLIYEYQGIAAPVERNADGFDVGAKFHVPDNTPFIRYFLSSFIQHQIFESLCKAAVFGRKDAIRPLPESIPLNRCDIYGSKSAGRLLKDFMSRGHSQHWSDILQQTIGQTDITATSLLAYYRPLYEKLDKLVKLYDIPLGW